MTIDSLANSGDGVGRVDNKVIFVPYTSPGDRVRVELLTNKKSFARARLIEIVSPSPHRVSPPCPYYGKCGGCDMQHLDYATQIFWKRENLLSCLSKIAKLEDLSCVREVMPSPHLYHYRNRLQIHLDANGPYFLQKNSHNPVYIDRCLIAEEAINEKLNDIPRPKKGRIQKIELASQSNGVGIYSVDALGSSGLGFRQVNSRQNDQLIQKTLSVFAEQNVSTVLDLYCGQGNWAKAIHQAWPQISCLGVDNNPTNISKAKAHTSENLQFELAHAENFLSQQETIFDLMILDPPRKGCDPKLFEALRKSNRPRFVVYISCHPATLARDLFSLKELDYSVQEILPVDMFPQTSHLETWCMLRSNS